MKLSPPPCRCTIPTWSHRLLPQQLVDAAHSEQAHRPHHHGRLTAAQRTANSRRRHRFQLLALRSIA